MVVRKALVVVAVIVIAGVVVAIVFLGLWIKDLVEQSKVSREVVRPPEEQLVWYLLGPHHTAGGDVTVDLKLPLVALVPHYVTGGSTSTSFSAGDTLTSHYVGTWTGETLWEVQWGPDGLWSPLGTATGTTGKDITSQRWVAPLTQFTTVARLRVTTIAAAAAAASTYQILSVPFKVIPTLLLVDWGSDRAQNAAARQPVRLLLDSPFLSSLTNPVTVRVDYLIASTWTPFGMDLLLTKDHAQQLSVTTTTPSSWQPNDEFPWRVKTTNLRSVLGYPTELEARSVGNIHVTVTTLWSSANYIEGLLLKLRRPDGSQSLSVGQGLTAQVTALQDTAVWSSLTVVFVVGGVALHTVSVASAATVIAWVATAEPTTTGFYTLSVRLLRDATTVLAEVVLPVIAASFQLVPSALVVRDQNSLQDDLYILAQNKKGTKFIWCALFYVVTVGELAATPWTQSDQWVLSGLPSTDFKPTSCVVQKTLSLATVYRLYFLGETSALPSGNINVALTLTFLPLRTTQTRNTTVRPTLPDLFLLPASPALSEDQRKLALDVDYSVPLTVVSGMTGSWSSPPASAPWDLAIRGTTAAYAGPVRLEYMERLVTEGLNKLKEGDWQICTAVTALGGVGFHPSFSYEHTYTFQAERLVPNATSYPGFSPLNTNQMRLRVTNPLNPAETWTSPLFAVAPNVTLVATPTTFSATAGATLNLTLTGFGRQWYKDKGGLRFQWVPAVFNGLFTLTDQQLRELNCGQAVGGAGCASVTSSSEVATIAACIPWTDIATVTAPVNANDWTWTLTLPALPVAVGAIRLRLMVGDPCSVPASEHAAAFVVLCSTVIDSFSD